jgi:hypothetical protein
MAYNETPTERFETMTPKSNAPEAATEEVVTANTTGRLAKLKNFVTSPTFIITAPVYVACGVAIVLGARNKSEDETEEV